jgi:outer membrane scaffolding protein for murein synthesis (MipA/OmpV family)
MKLLIILFTLSTSALAKDMKFGIGAGVSYANNFVGNETSKVAKNGKFGMNAFPTLSFQYKNFAIRGTSAEYSFFGRRTLFDMKLNVRYFGPKYENQYVTKRSPGFFAGGSLRFFIFNFRYNTDISSKSNGGVFDAFAMIPIPLSKKVILLPKIGVEKFSENFMNYYYGIAPHEAVEFSSYQFDKATDLIPLASLGIMYLPAKWLTLRLIVTYRNLAPEVTRSPIVNGDDQVSSVFMFVTNF